MSEGAAGQRTLPVWQRNLVIQADRLVYWLTRHWLLTVNVLLGLFLGLALLSPLLRAWGHESLGEALFGLYGRVCHQRPERSFFVQGEQVAFCQRDVGQYVGLILGGLLYGASGRAWRVGNWRFYLAVFVLPVAVDGLSQMVGLRQSNWMLRLGTGSWFGAGTAFFAYPLIEAGMVDTRRELEARFGPGLARLREEPQSPGGKGG